MKTLIMFSGGTDSTCLLYRMLTTTDDQIIVHRLRMMTEKRMTKISLAEDVVVPPILNWLRTNCRDFEYDESTLEMPDQIMVYPHFGYGYIGGLLMINGVADRMVTSRIKEDTRPQSCVKYAVARDIFYSLMEHGLVDGGRLRYGGKVDAEWEVPHDQIGKIHEYRMMPQELIDLVLTCRYPEVVDGKVVACQTCEFCVKVAAFMVAAKDETIDADLYVDALLKKKGGFPYHTVCVPTTFRSVK